MTDEMRVRLSVQTIEELRRKEPPQVRLSVSVPPDLATFARDAAAQADVSLSRFVAYCLEQHRRVGA